MQWQSWSQIWQDSTLLSALRRWWQSLTRLRFCGHLFLDCSCGPKSFRRLGARDNLYEDDSHDQSIQILWRSYKRQLHDFLRGTLRLPSCVAELRVKMCQPDVIFWKILNGRIWFPTRTEKYSDLIGTFFQDKKLLSNQHFGRPTLQKLRQCPLDLSSARSLLGPTPSPNFHKIPDRRATSFNELQWASMSFNESELAAHHIPSQAPCRNLRTQLWWSRQWQPWSVSGAGGPWLRFVLRQVAELANSGALTAPDEAAEITSLGRWSFANLHDDDDNILYYIILWYNYYIYI